MDTIEYGNLLAESADLFNAGKYNIFLDVFAKCYDFDHKCFEDDVNVFRFSFASYAVGGDEKINEFNRFSLLLLKYLEGFDLKIQKQDFLRKVKDCINDKFQKCVFSAPIIYFMHFNNGAVCLNQQYKLLELVAQSNLFEDNSFIGEEVKDINNMLEILRKVSRFTGSRYKRQFIYLPIKPKAYFNSIEKKLEIYTV